MDKSIQGKSLNIDLADYWMIIQKRFVFILLIFILVVLSTIYYTSHIIPEYQSTVKIKLSLRQPMATIQGAQITWYGSRGNEIPSEIKLIRNKTEILASVIDVLKHGTKSQLYLNNQDFFLGKDKKARDNDIKIIKDIDKLNFSHAEGAFIESLTPARLSNRIIIDQIPQTNIVNISINTPCKTLCIKIANILAVVYNIDYWKSKTTQAKKSLDFITEQLEAERKKLTKTGEKIIKTSQREAFLGSEEVYKHELTMLRITLDKLKERYRDKHPRIIKQKKLIKKLESDLSKIPIAITEHQENVIVKNAQRDFLTTLEELELKANIDYQSKKTKAQEEIQVISWAKSWVKKKPNVNMNISVGAIFGLLIGCLFAFIIEGLDTSIGKIEDVERITGLPVIAHIPLIGENLSNTSLIKHLQVFLKSLFKIISHFVPLKYQSQALDLDEKVLFNFDSMSIMSEAYRTLRTNIQFAIGGVQKDHATVIAITSTSPREGKTLTATNLSITLAQMGKTTLLLEADMRRPQIANLFKIDMKPGLSDLLIGTTQPEDAIRTITDMLMGGAEWDKLMETQGLDNLNVLPCGSIPPNPTELLISTEFIDLIESLKTKYDYIIIDTPPSLPVSDASIVGTIADGTVLIYQSDTTSRHLLLRALQNLRKNNSKLLGIIINQLAFDVTLKSKTGYSYSYSQLS